MPPPTDHARRARNGAVVRWRETHEPLGPLASDGGSRVGLHVGERFVLLLGHYTGTDSSVQLSDPSVLQRLADDGQGVYHASKPGTIELTAIGDPANGRARPTCGAPSRIVRFTVRVQ